MKRATVALTTILVLSAMLLFGGLVLVISGIDNNIVSESYLNVLSKLKARSCLEEVLLKLSRDTLYIGTTQITFTDGQCSAVVTDDVQPNIKLVNITSSTEEFNYQEQKRVDVSQSPPLLIN